MPRAYHKFWWVARGSNSAYSQGAADLQSAGRPLDHATQNGGCGEIRTHGTRRFTGTQGQRLRPLGHTSKLAEAERVERSTPEGVSRFERGGPAKCPTLPWRKEGDSNPHTLSREPRFQRGAIPIPLTLPYKQWRRRGDLNSQYLYGVSQR